MSRVPNPSRFLSSFFFGSAALGTVLPADAFGFTWAGVVGLAGADCCLAGTVAGVVGLAGAAVGFAGGAVGFAAAACLEGAAGFTSVLVAALSVDFVRSTVFDAGLVYLFYFDGIEFIIYI